MNNRTRRACVPKIKISVSALAVQSEKWALRVEHFYVFLQPYIRTSELETDVFLNATLKIRGGKGCRKIYPQLA